MAMVMVDYRKVRREQYKPRTEYTAKQKPQLPLVRTFKVEDIDFNDGTALLLDLLLQQSLMNDMVNQGILPIPNPRPLVWVKPDQKLEIGQYLSGEIVGFVYGAVQTEIKTFRVVKIQGKVPEV